MVSKFAEDVDSDDYDLDESSLKKTGSEKPVETYIDLIHRTIKRHTKDF